MLKWTVLLLLPIHFFSSLFALEISINSAIEEHSRYSILHLQDKQNFLCQESKNDFEIVTEIVCAYSHKPQKKLKNFHNDFFYIDTIIKKKTFFLRIKPRMKIKLLPVLFNLYVDDSVYKVSTKMATHWMIIGYKEKLPLINNKEKPTLGINFPFFMENDKLPFVGGLDIKGNPVHIQKVEDVTDYLRIKKYFKEKRYEKVMELIEEVLINYPNTLFQAELFYYKIRTYSQLKDYDNVIENAKTYLREYSSDENIPEVLSLVANAYAKTGMNIDADYFFDRLFSENKESEYTKWGYIYKGEMLEESGGTNAAIKFYKKALNETQKIDIAVLAAYKLAHIKITADNDDAAKYIKKIANAKPSFFAHDLKTSLDMMNIFSDVSEYETASLIAKCLSDTMNKRDDYYEELLKNRALWLSKTEHTQEALKAINKYIKEFPDGDFIERIDVAKDEMFFSTEESNETARLQKYNTLIEDYSNDSIGNRALYEKGKLLLNMKKYQAVLEMQDDLEDLDEDIYEEIPQIIESAAIGVMKESLKEKKCHKVLTISNEYNITLSNDWDDGIYECAMKGGDFQLALSAANRNIKSSNLQERQKWLYRYAKIDFQTGNYSEVIEISKDLIALIEDNKKSAYNGIYRDLFDTYERLEQENNMLLAIGDVEKMFGVNYKDLDRYVSLVTLGSDRKDDNIVIKYALKAKQIQDKSQSYPQSPLIEFALYQAYMNQEDYARALSIIKSLNDIAVTKEQRARQKYLLGTVYSKLWRDEEAMSAYTEAAKADPKSAWAKLALSASQL